MKHVVRYLLEGDGSVPKFIENGGHLVMGDELVGISVDDEKRHLPSTVHKIEQQELLERFELLGYEIPEQACEAWLESVGHSYEGQE